MFCSRCGNTLPDGAAVCAVCGGSVAVSVAGPPDLRRPALITCLAALQFIAGAIWLLAGVSSFAGIVAADEILPMGVPVFAAGACALGLVQLVCGVGLMKLRPYGRLLQIAGAVIGLLALPVGTIIAICILVYLNKPGVKALFSGKPAAELTAEETAAIAALRQGSALATVLVVIFVALGVVAAVGIGLAIAIPGLLRARLAANEVSAIGSLRAINSAQAAYAAAAGHGYYAVTLATLAKACPGSTQGFIAPDLSTDPTRKAGYIIALVGAGQRSQPDCNGTDTAANYYATAVPQGMATTGTRAFSTAAAGTVFFDTSGIPPSLDQTLAGSASPVGSRP